MIPKNPLLRFTLLLFVTRLLVSAQRLIDVHYKIQEELPNGSFVGNIVNDANLSALYDPTEFMELRFRFKNPIQPPNSFVLDPITGVLETGSSRIDREELCPNEEVCTIVLGIEITPVKLYKQIKVTVTIIDINDNEPNFPSEHLILEVSERANIGWTHNLKGAVDLDSPPFSIVKYSIEFQSNSQSPFEMRWEKPVRAGIPLVLNAPLDREKQDAYFANITATDGGNPPRSKTMVLEIRVMDENDNDPVFDQSKYSVRVMEDLPVGSSIIKVHATDADEGLNGQVVYSLAERSRIFRIDNITGEIILVSQLDYESKPRHELIVAARDQGLHPAVVYADISIEVEDVNDNRPQISLGKSSASVVENSPPGTYVESFSVKDPDSGDGGMFDCYMEEDGRTRNHNEEGTFFRLNHISQDTYFIETNSELDREKRESYVLKIFCDDRGTPSLRSEVFLNVLVEDVNDCTPTFERLGYAPNVTENNYEGSVVATLKANDCDVGENARISYKLLSGTEYFAIDQETGTVTTVVSIDRESHGDFMDFTVVATDGGHPPRSATTTVRVIVNDINDNRPIFDFPSYYFNVSENLSSPALVGRVRASDNDKVYSDNSKIIYSILPGISSSFFQIDAETGVMSTTRVLDRESESVHYFIVSAQDCGSPQLSTTVSITVVVDDRNDNPPLFEFPPVDNATIQLSTRATAGYEVAKFRATDLDSGTNGDIIYGMDNETLAVMGLEGLFELNSLTGILTLCSNDIRRLSGMVVPLKIWTEDKATYPDAKLRTESIVRIVFNISAPIVINGELVDGNNWMLVLGLYGDSLTTIALVGAATIAGLVTVIAVLIIFCLKKRRGATYRKEKNFDGEKQQQYNCRTGSIKMFPATTVDFTSDGEYGRSDIETPLNHGVKPLEAYESRSLLNNYAASTTIDIRPSQAECRSNIYTTQPVSTFGNYWPTVSQYGRLSQSSSQCPIIPESPLPPYQQVERSFEISRDHPKMSSNDQRPVSLATPSSRQLTRVDKEAKQLLEILKEDSVLESISLSSDQGANSDSGKGASEEGGDGRLNHNMEECNRLPTGGSVIAVTCNSVVCQKSPKVCSSLTSTHFGRSSPMFLQASARCPVQNYGSRCSLMSPVYENKSMRNSYGEIRYSVNQEHIKYHSLSPNQIQSSLERNVKKQDLGRCSASLHNNLIHINVYQELYKSPMSCQSSNLTIPSTRMDHRVNFLSARNCHQRNNGYKPLNREPDGNHISANMSCYTDEDDAISSTSGSYVVEPREK